jgi:hypothetical protein
MNGDTKRKILAALGATPRRSCAQIARDLGCQPSYVHRLAKAAEMQTRVDPVAPRRGTLIGTHVRVWRKEPVFTVGITVLRAAGLAGCDRVRYTTDPVRRRIVIEAP